MDAGLVSTGRSPPMTSISPDSAAQEDAISEEDFSRLLTERGRWFLQLTSTLAAAGDQPWGRRHYFQLITESDTIEAFLDDHGARYNRTFGYLTELVASLRGFSMAGLVVAHLTHRVEGYHAHSVMDPTEMQAVRESIAHGRVFIQQTSVKLIGEALKEAGQTGVRVPSESYPSDRYDSDPVLRQLPRNVGQEELCDEEQRIAEVASKFVQSTEVFKKWRVRRIDDPIERDRFLTQHCSEQSARSAEAAVHNLQSAYDTYIKNTILEAGDERLAKLRGHASAALHFLEAVTTLTHFVERHEGLRGEATASRLGLLVDRSSVQDLVLNHLLYWGSRFMLLGLPLAEDLLPSYTDVQSLELEIDDEVVLHARPASLIVGIVHRYGTPVEMEVAGERCNAGSMLEMMVAIGSNPQEKRFAFHGDVRPLQDIRRLFDAGLGESGLDSLPEELAYLREK